MRVFVVLFFLGVFVNETANAQQFPSRPIRLVVGFAPGGGVDINARLLAPRLSEYLGQQVVVENKPGAGTNIANEFVARSPADGYTLLINTAAVAINMSLYRNLSFDTLRDFAPVSVFSESPNVLVVNAKLPAASVKDLVGLARKSPGKLNYSSAGTRDSDTRKRMLEQGAEPVGSTPEDFGKLLREEVARWAEVVKISGARAD